MKTEDRMSLSYRLGVKGAAMNAKPAMESLAFTGKAQAQSGVKGRRTYIWTRSFFLVRKEESDTGGKL